MKARFQKFIHWIQSMVARSWYLPLVALFAALDSFFLIFPIDLLLITRVVCKPKGWAFTAFLITLGSAIGSVALALAIGGHFSFVTQFLSNAAADHASLAKVTSFIHKHGVSGVALGALSFVPIQFVGVASALEHIAPHQIFLGVFLGRGIKYFAFALICVYAPHWLPLARKVREQFAHKGTAKGE